MGDMSTNSPSVTAAVMPLTSAEGADIAGLHLAEPLREAEVLLPRSRLLSRGEYRP